MYIGSKRDYYSLYKGIIYIISSFTLLYYLFTYYIITSYIHIVQGDNR